MQIWQASIIAILGMSAVMAGLYAWGRQRENMATVDVGWTAGVGLVTCYFACFSDGWLTRKVLICSMVLLWSGRLFSHILLNRVLRESEEDARYTALRKHWGSDALRKFFWFFQAQGPLAVLFSVPPLIAMHHSNPTLTLGDVAGLTIWLVAWSGESLADRQLEHFRRNPSNEGRVCDIGLWRYSRHPNYFFEWLHWWAYVAMAIAKPYGVATLLGPILMYLFLTRITGIPYTEKQSLKTRGDAYRLYQQTTNRFFPWFPRKSTLPIS